MTLDATIEIIRDINGNICSGHEIQVAVNNATLMEEQASLTYKITLLDNQKHQNHPTLGLSSTENPIEIKSVMRERSETDQDILDRICTQNKYSPQVIKA